MEPGGGSDVRPWVCLLHGGHEITARLSLAGSHASYNQLDVEDIHEHDLVEKQS